MTVLQIASVMLLALRRPFKSTNRNRVEIAEECAIMISVYHIFCFTEFVPDPLVKHYIIGNSLIVCMALHLIIFLSGILFLNVRGYVRTLMIMKYKRRARKELKKIVRPGKTVKYRRAQWAKE